LIKIKKIIHILSKKEIKLKREKREM